MNPRKFGDVTAVTGFDSLAAGSIVKVVQRRSAIAVKPKHRGTLRALGLRRIGMARNHKVSPDLMGMLRRVSHLVEVREVN